MVFSRIAEHDPFSEIQSRLHREMDKINAKHEAAIREIDTDHEKRMRTLNRRFFWQMAWIATVLAGLLVGIALVGDSECQACAATHEEESHAD